MSFEPELDPVENPVEKPAPFYFSVVIIVLSVILYSLGALDGIDPEILRPLLVLASFILFVTGIHKDGWRSTLSAITLVLSVLLLLKQYS